MDSPGLESYLANIVAEAPPEFAAQTGTSEHTFHAAAYVQNFALKHLAASYPNAQRLANSLQTIPPGGGRMTVYRFGAIVFHNVSAERRALELSRLTELSPGLTPAANVSAEFTVIEEGSASPHVVDGKLRLAQMTEAHGDLIALILAQTVAVECYERIVEDLFSRLEALLLRMEQRGTVSFGMRSLHQLIGKALNTRSEALTVMRMLDDPADSARGPLFEPVHRALRDEFGLADRHRSILRKLESVQDTLELLVEAARDDRFVLLEAVIALLIVFQVAFTMLH
jgi:required for meiotic nuclear division protein 1